MKVICRKTFANGVVMAMKTDDGYPIETTDTFLPWYTKDAIGSRTNTLEDGNLGSRNERWMIGVSVMSGCPVGCKFCATGNLKRWRCLTGDEIRSQVDYVIWTNRPAFDPGDSQEFKINYTRMGEPFLNLREVRRAIQSIDLDYPNTHHYVSTVGITGSDFSWIQGNITLQVSLHSLDEDRRRDLIPFGRLMTIEQLGRIRTKSNQKTTVNLTLVDEQDFNIDKLRRYFDPRYFFVKLSPINPNAVAAANGVNEGIITAANLV